jgi:DNA-binding transcriptional MerR regulator
MKMLEEYPEILTITEVAKILRVTPLTLKRWHKNGKLIPMAIINSRGDRRYSKAQVLAFLGQMTGLGGI